jgi:hypothetical protein
MSNSMIVCKDQISRGLANEDQKLRRDDTHEAQKGKRNAKTRSDQVVTIGYASTRSRVGIDCGA